MQLMDAAPPNDLLDRVGCCDQLLEQTLRDVFTGPRRIYPVFNCI